MAKYVGPKTDPANVATQADLAGASGGVEVSATAPESPSEGDFWYDSEAGEMFIYYDSQWVAPVVPATVPTASASTITGVSSSEGSSTSFARADHTHQIKPPAVRAKHSTTVTTTNSTWTILAFDGEDFDTDNLHNNSTNNSRLTASQAGLYLVTGYVLHDNNTTGERGTNIFVNGTTEDAQTWGPASSFFPRHTVSSLISLAQNDYVQLRAYQNSGANRTVTPKFFSMIRVGTAP